MHGLKVENYILFSGHMEDLTWQTASQIALRDCFKELREEPGYIGVFATKKQVIRTSKTLLLIKEN